MDYCRNISVSGGLPSEYQPEQQVLSSSCSKLGSLDDLFSGHNPEGDVSLEWLSTFVEDCFSNSGNYFPEIPPNQQLQHNSPSTTTTSMTSANQQLQKTTTTSPSTTTTTTSNAAPKPPQKQQQQQEEEQSSTSPTTPLHKFAIPGKARTKRKRTPVLTKPKSQITKWSQSHHLILTSSSDPPLLHQPHWLADSELIVMPKTVQIEGQIVKAEEIEMDEEEEERGRRNLEEGLMMIMSHGQAGQGQQPARRCSHCLSQKTPQWRAGPLGPKTLCNACGVRYKSGRLLPEYRPAKSPTFVSFKHSNSHKKVMEMRNTTINTASTTKFSSSSSSSYSLLSKS